MTQETLPGTTDRRVAGLLTLLSENATIVISGARIAREIGVSRSTVWRWVERLRELGVRVKGQAATIASISLTASWMTARAVTFGRIEVIRARYNFTYTPYNSR